MGHHRRLSSIGDRLPLRITMRSTTAARLLTSALRATRIHTTLILCVRESHGSYQCIQILAYTSSSTILPVSTIRAFRHHMRTAQSIEAITCQHLTTIHGTRIIDLVQDQGPHTARMKALAQRISNLATPSRR